MRGKHVAIVGAGNSAGQAATHLAKHAATVTLLVRGDSLSKSMSDYLVGGAAPDTQRLRAARRRPRRRRRRGAARDDRHPRPGKWRARVHPERRALRDDRCRAAHRLARRRSGARRARVTSLPVAICRPTDWPLDRAPMLFETSLPGVFAAGDVRHGSVKRVTTAMGEGATAIQLVHQYLDTDAS